MLEINQYFSTAAYLSLLDPLSIVCLLVGSTTEHWTSFTVLNHRNLLKWFLWRCSRRHQCQLCVGVVRWSNPARRSSFDLREEAQRSTFPVQAPSTKNLQPHSNLKDAWTDRRAETLVSMWCWEPSFCPEQGVSMPPAPPPPPHMGGVIMFPK